MPRKKAAPTQARVWIELDPPWDKEQGDERAAMATNMLRRLGVERSRFWWSPQEEKYCYGDDMGYITLTDNGHWLNLEFLGRPLESEPASALRELVAWVDALGVEAMPPLAGMDRRPLENARRVLTEAA